MITLSATACVDAPAQLVSEALVELKGGPLGRLFEPLFAAMFARMAPNSLATFKYLVEHGNPFSVVCPAFLECRQHAERADV